MRMLPTIVRVFGAASALTAAASAQVTAATAPTAAKCRPADSQSAALVYELQNLQTTTDPDLLNGRDNVWHVPVVGAANVAYVTDEKVCQKAATAWGPLPGTSTTPAVYVVKLGNQGYAVLGPTRDDFTAFRTVQVYDRRWIRLGGWVGP